MDALTQTSANGPFITVTPLIPQNLSADTSSLANYEGAYCRFCFDTKGTLISICNCAGSVAFIHAKCLGEWLVQKIKANNRLEVPKCQLCQTQYAIRINIDEKKISFRLLWQKTPLVDKIGIIFVLLLAVAALTVVGQGFGNWSGRTTNLQTEGQAEQHSLPIVTQTPQQNKFSMFLGRLLQICRDFIFPLYFFRLVILWFQIRKPIWDQSYTQTSQMVFMPKVMLVVE